MKDSPAYLNKIADNQYEVMGALTSVTVPELYDESLTLFGGDITELSFDFQKVGQVDSAGFALVVEWQRLAKKKNILLQCSHITEQMRAIAKLSGLSTILIN